MLSLLLFTDPRFVYPSAFFRCFLDLCICRLHEFLRKEPLEYQHTAQAQTSCELLILRRQDFQEVWEEFVLEPEKDRDEGDEEAVHPIRRLLEESTKTDLDELIRKRDEAEQQALDDVAGQPDMNLAANMEGVRRYRNDVLAVRPCICAYPTVFLSAVGGRLAPDALKPHLPSPPPSLSLPACLPPSSRIYPLLPPPMPDCSRSRREPALATTISGRAKTWRVQDRGSTSCADRRAGTSRTAAHPATPLPAAPPPRRPLPGEPGSRAQAARCWGPGARQKTSS